MLDNTGKRITQVSVLNIFYCTMYMHIMTISSEQIHGLWIRKPDVELKRSKIALIHVVFI